MQKWSDVLDILLDETDNMMRFKLSWDPFRAPYPHEISRFEPSPNDVRTQWEARMESIKDAAEMGKAEKHNCSTMIMLYLLYGQDKDKIKMDLRNIL
jgi:hypothetical protein